MAADPKETFVRVFVDAVFHSAYRTASDAELANRDLWKSKMAGLKRVQVVPANAYDEASERWMVHRGRIARCPGPVVVDEHSPIPSRSFCRFENEIDLKYELRNTLGRRFAIVNFGLPPDAAEMISEVPGESSGR